MNERIKELIEQSTTYEKGPPVLGSFECYNSEITVFNKERFAELIIAECGRVALESDYTTDAVIMMKIDSKKFIEKYFGELIKKPLGVNR
jgi:hypothetical protein